MFKNKNVQIGLGVVLVVVLFIGGYFLIAGKKSQKTPVEATTTTVQTLKPQDLGLTMEVSPDKKKIKFVIAKATDIIAIEYQFTYEADSTAQELSEGGESRVQRGITGEAKIKSGESSFESEWLDLGSCSKNVCKYDKGVKSINLTLKVTKKNHNLYEVQDKLEL
jgi:hypothetical protein